MSEHASLPPAGWYPDPETGEPRYWDGSAWSPYADDATRRGALDRALAHQVAAGGVVADRGDDWAVVAVYLPGDNVMHGLHLVISLLTCFLWVPVWILLALVAKSPRHITYRLAVDRQARVTVTELK